MGAGGSIPMFFRMGKRLKPFVLPQNLYLTLFATPIRERGKFCCTNTKFCKFALLMQTGALLLWFLG